MRKVSSGTRQIVLCVYLWYWNLIFRSRNGARVRMFSRMKLHPFCLLWLDVTFYTIVTTTLGTPKQTSWKETVKLSICEICRKLVIYNHIISCRVVLCAHWRFPLQQSWSTNILSIGSNLIDALGNMNYGASPSSRTGHDWTKNTTIYRIAEGRLLLKSRKYLQKQSLVVNVSTLWLQWFIL